MPNPAEQHKGNRLLSSFVRKCKTHPGINSNRVAPHLGAAVGGNRQLERLLHISNQIRSILNTAADAHKVVPDTGSLTLVLGNTSMGHAGGNLAERLDTTQRLREGKHLGVLAEVVRSSLATLDPEAEHTTAHTVAVLLDRDLAVWVRVDTGVIDGDYVRGSLEGERDSGGISSRLAGAQVQRLQAAVSEPAVEGGGDGADRVLQEREALLDGVGVEGGGAHADVRVAVDVLCDGMHDDVGAVVERVLHIGAHEGVVDDDEDAMAVGDVDDGADVD